MGTEMEAEMLGKSRSEKIMYRGEKVVVVVPELPSKIHCCFHPGKKLPEVTTEAFDPCIQAEEGFRTSLSLPFAMALW